MSEQSDLLSRMTWWICQIVLKHVLLMKAKRSRLETGRSVADHDVSHESIMVNEADMDFRIPGLPHSVGEARAEYQRSRIDSEKLRTIQIDMLFNKIYDKINHLILSVQNPNKWFRMWVTSNHVKCSRPNPKRSAQYVSHTGIPVWSTARAGISCTKKQGSIGNSSNIRWTFLQSLSISSRSEDLMDIDMVKSRETKNIIRLTNWRRNAKREISKESITDSYEIKNSVFGWLKVIETKIFVDDGMLLADEERILPL